MWITIRYVILTALRDRLFFALLAGIIAAAYISGVMGSTALAETQAMTVSYAAGAARIILALGLTVFVCFHIRNAFESKEIDVILSRPISRSTLVLSYWLGFAAVSVLLLLPVLAIIGWLGWGLSSMQGFAAYAVSLMCELFLLVALALFSALILRSGVAAILSTLGFYALSRLMGYFIATSASGVMFNTKSINLVTKFSLDATSIVIPRLDFFAKTEWLVYPLSSTDPLFLFGVQTLIFLPLALTAAVIDFRRKQF